MADARDGPDGQGTRPALVQAPRRDLLRPVSDCIETFDDFGKALYGNHGHGGDELRLIPCPNSASAAIVLLPDIVMRELAGWR
jgi:hypothetical protein